MDADASLSVSFAKGVLGGAADLQAALQAGTVKDVKLDFGRSKGERIVLEDLQSAAKRGQFSAEYKKALQNIGVEPGWVFLLATVRTDGMTYTMKVDNSATFKAKTEGLVKQLLGADVQVKYEGSNTVALIIPNNQELTIGFAPLDPEFIQQGFGAVPTNAYKSDADLIKVLSKPIDLSELPPAD